MTRRNAIVVGSLLVLIVLSATPAQACSCAPLDPRSALPGADAAFVGALVSEKRGLLGPGSTTFTFRVEQTVKGSLGDEVDVQSSSNGASCGLEVVRGQRIGLLLYRDGGNWMSNLCWQADPDALLRAAGPLPVPDGSGPIRFAVGGKFGGIRLLALDKKGRTLGYGAGEGTVLRLSVCPGSRRMAEMVRGDGPDFPPRIAVRDVRTLDVLRETLLDRSAMRGITKAPGIDISAILCRDRFAQEVLAIATDWPEGSGRGHLLRIRAGKVHRAMSFSAQWGAFSGDAVHLYRGPNPADARMLISLDIRTGRQKQVAALPANTWQAAFSPGGRWLAGVIYSEGPEPSQVFLLDLAAGQSQPITRTLGGNVVGQMKWLDDRRVVFFPGGGDDDSLRVFDTSLRVLFSGEGWSDHRATVVGDVAYGIQDQSLVSARIPSGSVRIIRRFESPNTFAFVYVPGNVHIDAPMPSMDLGQAAPRPRVHTDGSGSQDGMGAWPLVLVPLAGLAVVLGLRHRRTRH